MHKLIRNLQNTYSIAIKYAAYKNDDVYYKYIIEMSCYAIKDDIDAIFFENLLTKLSYDEQNILNLAFNFYQEHAK